MKLSHSIDNIMFIYVQVDIRYVKEAADDTTAQAANLFQLLR